MLVESALKMVQNFDISHLVEQYKTMAPKMSANVVLMAKLANNIFWLSYVYFSKFASYISPSSFFGSSNVNSFFQNILGIFYLPIWSLFIYPFSSNQSWGIETWADLQAFVMLNYVSESTLNKTDVFPSYFFYYIPSIIQVLVFTVKIYDFASYFYTKIANG